VTGYDAELVRYAAVLQRAWSLRPGDRVLDVGCGGGATTVEAARVASAVLGVDVSAAAVSRARALAGGLPNVTFSCTDAQTHEFAPGSFDLAISRFGTMFFADPVAAFANIRRALKPAGRLVMLVWQSADRNEWDVTIRRALGSPPPTGPDAFSLAEPAPVLEAAGFDDIALTDVREPVYYGPDVAAALAWIRGFAVMRDAPADALSRLADALSKRLTEDGIWFDSRAWLVTARRG
jgi:SAM-dependent methyltransferase